ncbi:MAG TPA: 2OG-Fe(II) oxygenase [Candidatus Binatia bacterium]|nr:2OG-Fe(II) oxygenase [Candidatus Binatia bacterium]
MPSRPGAPSLAPSRASIARRLERVDWTAVERSLDDRGHALIPALLTTAECRALVALDPDDRRFRSRIDMERFGFGVGRYGYFARPLPRLVADLRAAAYPRLAPIANRWMEALGESARYPDRLDDFLARCAARGQTRPTPLLLRYEADGYNCLHRDLYGDVAFPLQLTCFLSEPGVDYDGGEFLLVEQRPRAQSRGEAIATRRGDVVVFPNAVRPVAGRRGFYRAHMRHGVSRVRRGERWALGVIFHDAR